MLQPLRWCCVDCMIHHERDVREEQKYMYVARTSNNRVIPMEWSWWVTLNNACEPGEQLIVLANGDDQSDLIGWSLLLLVATVRSFAHIPLGISDCNTNSISHRGKCRTEAVRLSRFLETLKMLKIILSKLKFTNQQNQWYHTKQCFNNNLTMYGLPFNMKSSSHKTWQTPLLFLKSLQIQNLKRKMWGDTAYYVAPVRKSGGTRPPCPPPNCAHVWEGHGPLGTPGYTCGGPYRKHNRITQEQKDGGSLHITAVIAWLESRFFVTRISLESRWERWWLDSTHVSHRMNRLESESFLQSLWPSDWQTQFVWKQRSERCLLQ